jgi:hypothetical protein
MVDIDVSEDGKQWFHLFGDLPCCNQFHKLKIILDGGNQK